MPAIHIRTLKLVIRLTGVLLLVLLPAVPAAAQSTAISQSYETSATGIGTGAIISLAASDPSKVELATPSNASKLLGIAADKPVLELSTGNTSSVQAVVSGSTVALVSDANGTVQAGDKITISPLAGVGMKAIMPGEIVGTAQKSLNSVKTVTEHVKGRDGKQITVHVGLLPVAVNVVYYTAVSSTGSVSAFVPSFLQDLANAVAGKAVSPLRVLIGGIVSLLGFSAVVVMLYVAVRSGIVSLGRNPLAEDALRRGMVDVLVSALGILLVTGATVAAILLV